ncbi:MAG: c-type cytochrome [Alphaproteobacteria bacterium]|nr:c-type cytochrome [Alphaproteobacteria bacterium]
MSAHDSHEAHGHHDPPVKMYTAIAVLLGVITGIELGPLFGWFNLPMAALLVLSAFKFGLVVLIFMHLWPDEAIYKKLFIPSLFLAIVMVCVMMLLFGSSRPEYTMAYTGPVEGLVAPEVMAARAAPPPEVEHGEGGGEAVAAAAVDKGATIFAEKCAACHAPDGTGGVGPNLTDSEWLHGGTVADIQHTVTNGVTGTAMISWTPLIGADGVKAVAAYVHGLGGGQ